MMSILIEQLINITDAIFLGHVGEIELGASALAGIWYLAIYMLGFGFSLGLQVVVARRNGERHYSKTGKTFFQGLFFLSGLAVFLCLFSKLFSPILLSRLITSAEVYHAVTDYLDGRIWGLLFSFPFLALRSFLVGITRTKALNMAALTAVLVNIPGNWLLIFHWEMGIAGAAIASSFAEACSLAVLAIHVLRKMDKQLYGLRWSFDKSVLQLAVANILRSISTLFFVIVNSFAATTGSLVSNLIGAHERGQVFPLCSRVIRLGYAIGLPLIALALVFHQMLLNYVFALPGYVYMNAVTGTGATRTAFIFQATTIAAYLLYLWGLSHWNVPLAVYWTVEYLFVIGLGMQSVIYLKHKHY